MSFIAAPQPECNGAAGSVELRIEPREKDLGGFTVRRVLPAANRRMVGPFIFFDHLGPAEFAPGEGISVRPHPHIGLATITYLFEGEILHRDSLGSVQPIRAGAVNLMTAGRGIVHSEHSAGAALDAHSRVHGIQSWMALPADLEEGEPAFVHTPAADLPELDADGVAVRVIIGEAFGKRSPVEVSVPMLYLECRMPRGSTLEIPSLHDELAAYVVSGEVCIDGQSWPGGVMAVARPGRSLTLKATEDSRVMVIGGATMGERHIWWNFVASSKQRIEQAKADWKAGRFAKVPGETEFIPLPD
ncbi:MAG: pirin family protein [Burkholderiales bacterium]